MITFHTYRVLIPVDFSQTSLHALKHGAYIAKLCKSDLILLHVQKKMDYTDIILPAIGVEKISEITQLLEDKLEQLAETVKKDYGIEVTAIVSSGNVTSEITNMADEYKAGLIVMGTCGADSHSDLFLGSNSYKVLTKSSIPVMTVRHEAVKQGYPEIVLPIDSSEHSRQKVKATLQFAAKFGSTVYAIGLIGPDEPNYEYKMEHILKQIKKLADHEKLICHTEIIKTNHRSLATLDYVKKINADLIITMADQKTEFSRAILSTYAHELINNAGIPVISIPPEIHAENFEQDSIGGMW